MILFLRIDTRSIGKLERNYWISVRQRFARKVFVENDDAVMPYLNGLVIGITRNDEFPIDFCHREVNSILSVNNINVKSTIGELDSLVKFMKAAVSKSRVVNKLDSLLEVRDTKARALA